MNDQTTQLHHRQFSATVLAAFSVLCLGMAVQLLADMPSKDKGTSQIAGLVTTNNPAVKVDQRNYSVNHVVSANEVEIQAEDFASSIPGVGYWDNTKGNDAAAYRDSDVDVAMLAGGKVVVQQFSGGEWLKFEVSNVAAGLYRPLLNLSSADAAVVGLEIDGKFVGRKGILPTGAGVYVDVNITPSIQLSAGTHQIRVIVDNGNLTLDKIEFIRIN